MKWKRFAALGVLMLFATVAMGANFAAQRKTTKQTGGSTGDSLIVGADTSSAVTLGKKLTAWHVIMAADSATVFVVQVSPNAGSNWFTVATDSCVSGGATVSASLSLAYMGWQMRVITDNATAAGAPFGVSYLAFAR